MNGSQALRTPEASRRSEPIPRSQASADLAWWRHGVFYQIYPRSFQDSNGDGVGDLRGIIARLDYLNGAPGEGGLRPTEPQGPQGQGPSLRSRGPLPPGAKRRAGQPQAAPRRGDQTGSLGVDAIWISPFYPSPMADFGYDVSDFCDVHPRFGTLADFDELVREAHARGIRVIVDLVPNHTSDRHPWFLEARSSRTNRRRDWYVWADPKPDGSPPNNWVSVFDKTGRPGSAWTLDPTTGQYYLHHFLPSQPDLNWWNDEVRRAMEGVMRFWLDRGVDGFRIDVAHGLIKDRELRDNPRVRVGRRGGAPTPLRGPYPWVYDWDRPEVHDIHRAWRRLLDSYGERMAVGEVYILDIERMCRYYGAGDELHLAFNFAFLRQPWKAEGFRREVERFERLLPEGAWPSYTLSNHDHPRHISRYATRTGAFVGRSGRVRQTGRLGAADLARGRARARVAAMMLLTLRGTPFLYYGEEIGMTDVSVPRRIRADPVGRDPERTPMQWDQSAKAAFTSGDPWLPFAPARGRATVEAQRDDPRSLFTLYRRLIALRRETPALHAGSYRALAAPPGVFAYLREAEGRRVLVALNFQRRARSLALRRLPRSGRLVLSTDPDRAATEIDPRRLRLAPNEGVIVALS